MALTYGDIVRIVERNPEMAYQNVSIWNPNDEECMPVENAYINSIDSETSDILDEGHLVLVLGE